MQGSLASIELPAVENRSCCDSNDLLHFLLRCLCDLWIAMVAPGAHAAGNKADVATCPRQDRGHQTTPCDFSAMNGQRQILWSL